MFAVIIAIALVRKRNLADKGKFQHADLFYMLRMHMGTHFFNLQLQFAINIFTASKQIGNSFMPSSYIQTFNIIHLEDSRSHDICNFEDS